MESVSYKIKIRASVNGVEKIPSKIAWIQGNDECLLKPCYKENDYLVVELIPGCVGNACIEGWLIFDDTCSNCEPIHFKRCFCSTNADCEDCEECNQQGICQSKCLDGEYCLDNNCVECDPNNPCPDGKVCINGKCVCPQGYFEKNGKCIQCDETTILNKCQECKNGLIVDKPCAGKCNPVTGDCVDCLTSGDCFNRTDGKNCCNPDTKACECCPGTAWDAEQGKCVPVLCTNDEECGDPCLKCTLDGCKPMICPPGMKCWNGECVDWPCINTSCENGADCGPDCGCVEIDGIKQCVPCAILACLGLCEQALGCTCKDNNVCGPVDNCNDYCDGETPCSDPNCTCYNNRCVSCENFPCDPNDCDSRPNCGCSGGDCEGGVQCKDKLEIVKDCGTNKTDCKLTAKLTAEKPCKCDDIRFETSNIFTCTPSQNTVKLKVNLFKGQVPYNDFTNVLIGDNELVEGVISTKITHYDIKGNVVDVAVTKPTDKSIIFNSIQEIELIRNEHFKINYTDSFTNVLKGTKVKIEIIAKNIKVPSNNCINYKNETVIAEYLVDFLGVGSLSNTAGTSINITNIQVCFVLNNSFSLQKAYINDKVSIKKPLFIWSKSATDFPSEPYDNNGNYDSKGWFRKEYGVKTSTGWEDVLSTVDQGLVNNYNYVVKTDCGCAKLAVHNNLDFCCLPDVTPILENCNTKLKFPAFKVCDINGKINDAVISDFNKAYYRLLIIHSGKDLVTKEIAFNNDGVTTLPLNYEDPGKARITGLRLERYFKGGLLKELPCTKDIDVPVINIPEIIYNATCNIDTFNYTVILNQVVNGIKILNASFIKKSTDKNGTVESSFASSIVMGNSSQKSINIPIKNGSTGFFDPSKEKLVMLVNFEGGCSEKYDLPSCEPKITTEAKPSAFSGKNCPSPTIGPSIETTVVGLAGTLQYSLNNGAYQTSNVFTNLDPGTYNIKVKGTLDGVDTILEDTIVIEPKLEIQVSLSPSTICAGESSSLNIIGEPNTTYTIQGPNGSVLTSIATTNSQGLFTYPNLMTAGNYTVIPNTSSNKFCSGSKTVTLTSGGETLTPTITFQAGSYCVGQPIPFRIFDNGKNRTYNLITTNGSITSPIQATDTGFNGEYIPSSLSGSVTIQSSTSSCDNMIPVTVSTPTSGVTITTGPVIGTPNVTCVDGLHTVVVNITGATSVTIGGVLITPVGSTYTRTGITGVSNIDIVANNGSCTITEDVVLQNCDCPDYDAVIQISAPTCGQGSQTITVLSSSSNLIGTTYQLQEFDQGQWWNIPGEDGVFALPAPTFTVNNQLNNPKSYRLLFTDSANCTLETNFVTTSGTAEPTITINESIPNSVPLGSTLQLTALGGISGTTTYLWTGNNVTGQTTQAVSFLCNAAGTFNYSVTATTGSCVSIVNYTVIVANGCPSQLTAAISETGFAGCKTFTATATGGTGTITYEWLIDNTVVHTGTTYNGQGMSAGDTENVTLRVTSNDGNCVGTTIRSYTKCQYDSFVLDTGHSAALAFCTGITQGIAFTTLYKTPCAPSTSIDIFVECIINAGGPDIIIGTDNVTWIGSNQCGVSYGIVSTKGVSTVTYGGDTLTLKTKTYLGTDNLGTLIGTANLGTVTIPATC